MEKIHFLCVIIEIMYKMLLFYILYVIGKCIIIIIIIIVGLMQKKPGHPRDGGVAGRRMEGGLLL